ncbi:MAG TPA: alkaline phosphatase D family protein [Candidatus Acidoferrum sp.]|nr:alkaline phosphatase D family protein [Candidatus Acidoferrum sp.]
MLLAGAAPAPARPLVTVTEVRSAAAIVWARARSAGVVGVEVGPAGGGAMRSTLAQATAEADLIVRVPVDGLAPATRHRYQVTQNGERVEGEFTTAPAPEQASRVTFLWSGDLGGGGHCRPADGEYRIFRTMARHPADFFLFVGDTTYADVACNKPDTAPGANFRASTLAEYRARHRYNREDAALQAFLRRTPVYAIWDDHEVKNDFAGTTEPLMPIGRQAFLDYWPVAAGDDPTRLYRSVRWGRLLEIFILDTRQYRSDNGLPDSSRKTMLGAAQRRWLLDALPASTATWKIMVSSVPLSVPTGRPERRDSWSNANVFGLAPEQGTGFVTERDAILREFRVRGVRNLVVLAADVHHAEVIRHQPHREWAFHELIAGPLSATTGRPRPLDERLGPRTLFAQGGIYNFGEVTIDPTQLTVRLVDDQGTVLFTHTIAPE